MWQMTGDKCLEGILFIIYMLNEFKLSVYLANYNNLNIIFYMHHF